MELVLNWAERDMIVIGSRREMCAWAGTSQLLQCEGGHWSGEAAPSHLSVAGAEPVQGR